MEPVLGFLDEEEFDEDYDESRLPRSGLEYLRRVQIEATECPEVVVADISCKSFNKQTVNVNEVQSHMPAPKGWAPSLEWQLQQAADFADVRQRMAHFKAKYRKIPKQEEITLPNKNDEARWRLFCLGNKAKEKGSVGNLENEAHSESNTGCPNQEGNHPLFSILVRMNQVTIQHVLEYHVNWLEQGEYSHMQGRWLYSLLACLEKPLLPESTALLRTLARHCAALRVKKIENCLENNEIITSLNLIIVLVTRYFGQTDLADSG